MAEIGIPSKTFETDFRVGPPVDQQARIVYPDGNEELWKKAADLYRHYYDTSDMEGEVPYPWSEEILKNVLATGKKIYVVTYKRFCSTVKLIEHYSTSVPEETQEISFCKSNAIIHLHDLL